jgi:hypothetical protein
MKTRKIVSVFVLLVSLLLMDCDLSTEPESETKYAKKFWGEWLRMDAEETWYINSAAIEINKRSSSKEVSLNKQSDRVLEVTEGSRKYYLYASRITNTSFPGRIASLEQGSLSSRVLGGGIGGIGVAISNLNDQANKTTTTTDADGNFTAEGIIPGDNYVVTPDGGQPTTVSPSADGDDIGTITIPDGAVNFKTSISAGTTIRYPNTRYDFTLSVKNTGTEDCSAATFQLNFDSELDVISTPASLILGTIEPGKEKTIPIAVMCKPFSSDYEFRKIGVTITDTRNNKTWNDSVSIKFSNEKESYRIKFNIRANSAVSGVIITPNSGVYRFNKTTSESLSIPWSPQDYLVVFSGATADTEAAYSFATNVTPDTNFDSLSNPMNYEPNDTETAATVLSMRDGIMSYLDKNDIDYYKINFPLPGLSELYVSSSGSDTNNGETPERPLATVSKALELIKASRNTYSPMSIVISGIIREKVSISDDYPPIELRGNSAARPGTLNGNSGTGSVLTIEGGKVTLGENLTITGGTSGGVSVYNGTFTMTGGEISGNTDFSHASGGGGVYVRSSTFTMIGGEISGNTVSSSSYYESYASGGGVYVYRDGTFTKMGGIIYGDTDTTHTAGSTENTATGGRGEGHAVYVSSTKKRNSTAGPEVVLDSTKAGSAGGWE